MYEGKKVKPFCPSLRYKPIKKIATKISPSCLRTFVAKKETK